VTAGRASGRSAWHAVGMDPEPGTEAAATPPQGGALRCAECGRPITRRGASGGYVHRSRGAVAACDLDADHEAVPESAETPGHPI
jgi:hypothetical protein